MQLLHTMVSSAKEPTIVSYNTVLGDCTAAGVWERAAVLLAGVLSVAGLQPSVVTRNTAIVSWLKGGGWVMALAMAQGMAQLLVEADAVTCNTMITACEKGGEWRRALQMLASVRHTGECVLDSYTYSGALRACETAERWALAVHVLDDVTSAAVVPNLCVFNTAIMALQGSWPRAVHLLSALPQLRLSPSVGSVPRKRPAATTEDVTEEHILDEYGDFAEMYEETVSKIYHYETHVRAPPMLHEELSKRVKAEADGRWRLLDLGCGTGFTAAYYFQAPCRYDVVGVDLTPEMVEKARGRQYSAVLCQNIEAPLGVEDGSFDAAQMLGVTEFLNRPAETFAEVRRKLTRSGLLLVTSPKKIRPRFEQKYKIKTWMEGELEGHIERCGFTCLRTEHFRGYNLGDVDVLYRCTLWQRVPLREGSRTAPADLDPMQE